MLQLHDIPLLGGCQPDPRQNAALQALVSHRGKNKGRYFVADDSREVLDMIHRHAAASPDLRWKGVVWTYDNRPGEPPEGFRLFPSRNSDNCEHWQAAEEAGKKGYNVVQMVCRRCALFTRGAYHSRRCSSESEGECGCRDAKFPACEYQRERKRRPDLLAVPPWALRNDPAKHGTLVVLHCFPPAERAWGFGFNDWRNNGLAPEYREVVQALFGMADGMSRGASLEGRDLYEPLDQRIDLSGVAALSDWRPPRSNLKEYDPLDGDPIGAAVRNLPRNFAPLFEAVSEDTVTYGAGGEPSRVTVDPRGVTVSNEKTMAQELAWLSKKPVIVLRRWLEEWEPILQEIGLEEVDADTLCPPSTQEKLVMAATRLKVEDSEINLSVLSREAGVSVGTVYNYKEQLAEMLDGKWVRRGRGRPVVLVFLAEPSWPPNDPRLNLSKRGT